MRKLLIAALIGLCAAGPAVIGGAAAHAAVTGCTGTFQVGSITFDRPSVNPGQLFTATTTVQNCTTQTQTVGGYWIARSIVPTEAPFCTGNDPFPMTQASIPAGGTYTTKVTYSVYSGCTATAITVTAVIYSSPNISQSATIPVGGSTSPPPSTCTVSYHNDSEWSTGFVALVTLGNRGTAPITGWSLSFNFPGDQRVTNSWGATVQQNGTAVTAVNAPWTATIAAGGSVSFGMYGSWQRSDAAPTAFTLNGQACQAG